MATAKAAAPRKAATAKAATGRDGAGYVVTHAFTLRSDGSAHLVGERFDGTAAQAKVLLALGMVREA